MVVILENYRRTIEADMLNDVRYAALQSASGSNGQANKHYLTSSKPTSIQKWLFMPKDEFSI